MRRDPIGRWGNLSNIKSAGAAQAAGTMPLTPKPELFAKFR